MKDQASHDPKADLRASLFYLQPHVGKPFRYTFDTTFAAPPPSWADKLETVRVRDARTYLPNSNLDQEGFELISFKSQIEFNSCHNGNDTQSAYYIELNHMLKDRLHAKTVITFDHCVRDTSDPSTNRPAPRVHNDYTPKSGQSVHDRFRLLLLEQSLEDRDYMIVVVWRPLVEVVQDLPLALCDASSVSEGDLIYHDVYYYNRIEENFRLIFNPNHKWYFFSNMRPAESILIKCYDSRVDGRARYTPHAALLNTRKDLCRLRRRSVEARALIVL